MPVLVTDFDGTITRNDFYRLVIDEILPPNTPDYWNEYAEGRITHFDALNLTFAAARPGEQKLIELIDQMDPDPNLAEELRALRDQGWQVVIVSAGCRWYIDRILAKAGATDLAEVHANGGNVVDGRLRMTWPDQSPYFSPDTGIDKSEVVLEATRDNPVVAFAGNGLPDLSPSLIVNPDLRWARADLAEALTGRGESFHPFERWSEVSRALRSGIKS